MDAQTPGRAYPYVGPDRPIRIPDYSRIVRVLTDAELEEEILEKRGEPDYQMALLQEYERRAETKT